MEYQEAEVLAPGLVTVSVAHTATATPMRCFDGIKGGKYFCVQTVPQFRAFMGMLVQQKTIAVDTETSGVNWVEDHACGIVIGWGVAHSYYLPIEHKEVIDGEITRSTEKQLDLDTIRPDLQRVLGDDSITKILWNAKFDLHFLRKAELEVSGIIHDGIILIHLLDENISKALKSVSKKFLGGDADKWEGALDQWRIAEGRARKKSLTAKVKELLTKNRPETEKEYFGARPFIKFSGLTKAQITSRLKKYLRERFDKEGHAWTKSKKDDISYDFVPLEIMAPYACADVHYTWLLFKQFFVQVAGHPDLSGLYVNEMSLCRILFETESAGVQLDIPYLQGLVPKFEQELDKACKDVYAAVGYEFNINSPDQLIAALQGAGCRLTKLTKGAKKKISDGEFDGEPKLSVDKDVLEELATKYPFAAKVQRFRTIRQLLNTYAKNMIEMADSSDYLHSTFTQNVSTGRMQAKKPNINNIPGQDMSIRRAFITPLDVSDTGEWLFLFIDYCLTGDTEVVTIDGVRTIAQVVAQNVPVLSCSPTKELAFKSVSRGARIGKAPVFEVFLDDGSSVRCTADHTWMTRTGEMIKTCDMKSGQRLMHVKESHASTYLKVVEVVPCGVEDVYQITVDDWHTYVLANGLVSGNSQIELRLTAHHSKDSVMMQCYPWEGEGIDIHTLTCAEVIMDMAYVDVLVMKSDFTGCVVKTQAVCPCPGCTVKHYRNIAKRVNFGIIYGAGAAAIQRQVSRPERPVAKSDCETYIEKYFAKYQGVKDWIAFIKSYLRRNGYVQNTFGRYRRLPDGKSSERWKQGRAARQGGNFMIQGDAADLFKTAIVRVRNLLHENRARTRIVNFVHDELQFYWHRDELGLLSEVKHVMEDFDFSVPVVAEIAYAKRDWASKKELKG